MRYAVSMFAALILADFSPATLDAAGMSPKAKTLLVSGAWVRCASCSFVGAPKGWGRRRATGLRPAGRVCPGCRPQKSLAARLRGTRP